MTTEGGAGSGPELRLEAIVLAGGAGVRFGGAKLTAPWRGGRLIDGALTAAFAAPVRSVTVVTGADPAVGAAAKTFAAAIGQTHRLRLVHADDHAEGMGATLRTGVAALPPDAEGAFVFLGDMPLIPAEILPRLAAALAAAGAQAVAPRFEGQRGHPVLFGAALLPALRDSTGDEGARAVLLSLGGNLVTLDTSDPGVLFDVDRPEPS
ncbi:MAG: molybdopterin-guanine dinucleotide biosynthesis protein [Caulobacteraceae bacterium]|nr:molybdopterin-guanine dinucleotide biosynthesis protein [Caulobacteraceae bacterium]